MAKKIYNGCILELGAGYGSTPLLHEICRHNNNTLITIETNESWARQFNYLRSEQHQIFNTQWTNLLELVSQPWDLVFVDQEPWESRHEAIKYLKDLSRWVILHDSDYFVVNNIFQYDDYFTNYKVFMPPEPYPYVTGPPTLLASNLSSCDLTIDYTLEEFNGEINFDTCGF